MKLYTIRYEEKNVAFVNVVAADAIEAMSKVETMKQNGEIDSKLETIGSSVSVV